MVDYTDAYIKKIKNKKNEIILSGVFDDLDIEKNQHVSILNYKDLQNIIKSEGFDDTEKLIKENQQLKEELDYQNNKIKDYKRKLDEKDKNIIKLINKIESLREKDIYHDSAYFEHKYMDTLEYVEQLKDEINYHNQLLFNAQLAISKNIDSIVNKTVNQANEIISDINDSNSQNIDEALNEIGINLTKHNSCIANNIQQEVKKQNKDLQEMSFWDLLFHRKDFNFSIDTDDLNEEISPKIKASYNLLKKPNVKIDSNKIKEENELYDFHKLWIETKKNNEFQRNLIDTDDID
ncbi:hypothetical protein BGI41_08160 [Methanobrevibacter sp. 87.7]|uniref:hypothetical protein n=1 Tax=Methanobrevibacter sp. 87.7 TaxID=387957 RepID=UPI000B508951|nr:hypothetical protein [Methanobrevibacter sp. 87.7]OWT32343.1 hypothetical protein BGI41_08160 [Methanobrevibacter sp. 87.7]